MSQVSIAYALGWSVPTLIKHAKRLGFDPLNLTATQIAELAKIQKGQRAKPSLQSLARRHGPERRHYQAMREIARQMHGASGFDLTTEQVLAVAEAYAARLNAEGRDKT